MAKKRKSVFVCQECGYESPQWMGQCICGAWNSFIEERITDDLSEDSRRRTSERNKKHVKAQPLKSVGTLEYRRMDTGIGELNRVLGGGLVPGSLILISGEPGIGKSTLIIQAAAEIAAGGKTVLYASGEESEEQIRIRADRVCRNLPESLLILSETNMENIVDVAEQEKVDFLIIDSIQTMYTDELTQAPGSISQVRACGNMLMKLGKTKDIPIFIVAHVTKAGELAGPKIVEHLVDCVLHFGGERNRELRMLRAFKNRFGTTSEVGAFKMEEEGLVEITDLSGNLLEETDHRGDGAVITAVYEGTRPVLFEIQGLAVTAAAGFPRRTAVGVDSKRLNMILAVIEKRLGIGMVTKDVYVNAVGGMRTDSTSVDLATALAIYSSIKEVRASGSILVIGEIGLTGEVRSVPYAEKIFSEAERMGFDRIMMPQKNAEKIKAKNPDCNIVGVKSLRDAVQIFSSK